MDNERFSDLSGPAFLYADALDAGIGRATLRRLEAPHRGVRIKPGMIDDHSISTRASHYAPRLASWQFFSHETALALLGVPSPRATGLHVATHRPQREPRIVGVIGHRLQRRDDASSMDSSRIRVEHPVRAWRQCATLWKLDDLIAAADHLVARGGFRIADLAGEIDALGDRHGILARALSETRVGAESVRETRLRLAITRSGLPEPELNMSVFDDRGTFVARLDLAYPRFRIGLEYDGRQHAFDVDQFERDAERWRSLERNGWRIVRILSPHLAGGGRRAVLLVAEALRDAGWHPGSPAV